MLKMVVTILKSSELIISCVFVRPLVLLNDPPSSQHPPRSKMISGAVGAGNKLHHMDNMSLRLEAKVAPFVKREAQCVNKPRSSWFVFRIAS